MDVSHSLALCLLAFFSSSGSGGIGYGYFLLEAIDPVDEDGDFAGDSVLKYGPSVFLFTSSTHLATLYSLLNHGFKYLQKAMEGTEKAEEQE